VWIGVGTTRFQASKFNRARAYEEDSCLRQLGIAYFGSPNTIPQAVSAFEKFLQLNPSGPDAETAKQLVEAAKAQLKK